MKLKIFALPLLLLLIFSTNKAQNYDEIYIAGNVKYLNHDFHGAADDFTQVIALKSNYAEAYYNRALAYEQLQKTENAFQGFLGMSAPEWKSAEIILFWNTARAVSVF